MCGHFCSDLGKVGDRLKLSCFEVACILMFPDALVLPVCILLVSYRRHSSITMNDDEWPETLGPFVEKLEKYDRSQIPDTSVLAFLRDWESPVNEDNQEELTKPGARDSAAYGRRIRELYPELVPSKHDPPFKFASLLFMCLQHLMSPSGFTQQALPATSIQRLPSFLACTPVESLVQSQA